MVILCAMVVSFLFWTSLWSPRQKVIGKLKGDVAVLKQQEESAQALLTAMESQLRLPLKEEQDSVPGEGAEKWERLLERAGGDPSAAVAITISTLSDRQLLGKALLRQATVGNREKRKGFSAYPITLELEGSYTSIVNYLQRLEEPQQPLGVLDFNMTSQGNDGFLVAKIDLELYLSE